MPETTEEKYRLIQGYLTKDNISEIRDFLRLEVTRLRYLSERDRLNVDGLPQHILNELVDTRDDQRKKIDTLDAAIWQIYEILYPYKGL